MTPIDWAAFLGGLVVGGALVLGEVSIMGVTLTTQSGGDAATDADEIERPGRAPEDDPRGVDASELIERGSIETIDLEAAR